MTLCITTVSCSGFQCDIIHLVVCLLCYAMFTCELYLDFQNKVPKYVCGL